jgi:CarD family transcriptional regulator
MALKDKIDMANEGVVYHVGDAIVHWNYGLGTIVAIEEKDIGGVTQKYYVVDVEHLQLWVPVEEGNTSSIRFPTEGFQFEALFDILRTPGEPLPDHQFKRRLELQERMKKKTLADLCHLIRDLADRSRQHSLNQNDSAVLSRAEDHLLDEWARSMEVERANAASELDELLRGGLPESGDQ